MALCVLGRARAGRALGRLLVRRVSRFPPRLQAEMAGRPGEEAIGLVCTPGAEAWGGRSSKTK
jgi:hypothetical protein